MRSPVFSLVMWFVQCTPCIGGTLIASLHSPLCIIAAVRGSTVQEGWSMSACGNISTSLLPTTAALSVFPNEERRNKDRDRPCCNHGSFTGGKQYFLAGPLRLFLASAYCSRAAPASTWNMAFWETLKTKHS